MKSVTGLGTVVYRIISGRSNVFLVKNQTVTFLVDTSPARKWKLLQQRLSRLGIGSIDFLILTHTHFDHAANACLIKEKYGAKAIVHISEQRFLEAGENIIPEGTNRVSRTLIKVFKPLFKARFRYKGVNADIQVTDKLDLSPYGINAEVIHTPGHTPGSVSVIVDNEIALVGDSMFGVFPGSAFPPFSNDVPAMIHSWDKLLSTGCKWFLPSHGSEVSRELLHKEFQKYKHLLPVRELILRFDQ